MIKEYLEDVRKLIKSKVFVFSLLAIAVISFGYATCNTSLSIDDTEGNRYTGSGNEMLSAGRFGIWFWSFIQGNHRTHFSINVLAVFLFVFACINLCILFRRISGGKISLGALTVFSCFFLSYPLMNEIWEYTGSNVIICGGFLFTSFCLLCIHSFIHKRRGVKGYLSLIASAFMLMLLCAGYESVVPVYIFFVFAVIALQIIYGEEKEKRFWEIIRQGSLYAGLLIIGLLLRVIVHKIILVLFSLQPVANGATKIFWGEKPIKEILAGLCNDFFVHYIFRSVIYLPLLILVICGIAFIIMGLFACKKHGAILLLPGFGMLLSLVILSFVQGVYSPYRTCQVFGAFCAFCAMMLISCFPKKGNKVQNICRICAITLCGLLCFYQASYLGQFLELNHQRSKSEEAVVRQVSYDLRSEFDQDKPVIFVGSYKGNASIYEKASVPEDSFRWKLYKKLCVGYFALKGHDFDSSTLSRKIPVNNVSSILDWATEAFGSQESMAKVFSYYGCEYVPADFDTYYEPSKTEAESMPKFPEEGYIRDMGDYLIVSMG